MSVDTPGLASEAIELLQALIQIDTSNPGRPELPAAAVVTSFLAARDVKARVLAKEPGRASVVAKIDGTDPAHYPSLLLLSHLDTVPVADPDRWSQGPFSGDITNGFVWGRGALDDKGRTAINAATIAALAIRPPPGDILFAALADEEEGGALGAAWLRNDHPEVLAADYALGEGGGYVTRLGGRDAFTYAVAEKGAFRVRLRFRSEHSGGHAAIPGRENPAMLAAEAALALQRIRWSWTATQPVVDMLKALGHSQPMLRRLGLRALRSRVLGPLLLQKGWGLSAGQRDALHAMLHTTVAVTALRAGQGGGALPDDAEAQFAVRYPPTVTFDQVDRIIRRPLSRLSSPPEITVERPTPSRVAPTDSPLARAIRDTITDLSPGAAILPILLPASTDLRELDAGVVAYGFTPMRVLDADAVGRLVHGRDERIAIADVGFGIDATIQIARRLGTL